MAAQLRLMPRVEKTRMTEPSLRWISARGSKSGELCIASFPVDPSYCKMTGLSGSKSGFGTSAPCHKQVM